MTHGVTLSRLIFVDRKYYKGLFIEQNKTAMKHELNA